MACLGVITVGQQRVFVLFFTLSAASAAACLRLLCVEDLIGRATSMTNMSTVACSLLGQCGLQSQRVPAERSTFWSSHSASGGIVQQSVPVARRWTSDNQWHTPLSLLKLRTFKYPGAVYSGCVRAYVVRCFKTPSCLRACQQLLQQLLPQAFPVCVLSGVVLSAQAGQGAADRYG